MISVGSLNNDRTIMAHPYAWRSALFTSMTSHFEGQIVYQHWRQMAEASSAHSIQWPQINRSLCGRYQYNDRICSMDRYYLCADKVVRFERVFWHFLSLNGAEIAQAALCDTHNCPTWQYMWVSKGWLWSGQHCHNVSYPEDQQDTTSTGGR